MAITASSGQTLLAILESDILTAAGAPLLQFLTAFGAAGGDQLKIAMAFVALQGELVGSLPSLESALSQQLAAALTAKLQAAIAGAQAKPA